MAVATHSNVRRIGLHLARHMRGSTLPGVRSLALGKERPAVGCEDAYEIRLHHTADLVDGCFFDRANLTDAGIVDQVG